MNVWFRCRIAATLGCWLGLAAALVAADPIDPFARCLEIASDIPAQVRVERAACSSMLAAGLEAGWWTEEGKRVAEDWLSYLFADDEEGMPPVLPSYLRPEMEWRRMMDRVVQGSDPTADTAPVLAWMQGRLRALHALRGDALRAANRIVIERAERAWLSARSPADLEAVVRDLVQLKSVLGFRWGELARQGESHFTFPLRPLLSNLTFSAEELQEFHDCWSIIASPEPLLLPDPDANPAGFAKARRDWLMLRPGSQGFLKRPVVASHFAKLDGRFRAAFLASQRKLDAAILRDAPAAEFEKELARLRSFAIATPPPGGAAMPAMGPRPPNPNSDIPPDYREKVKARRDPLPPDFEMRWASDYAGWLAWRRAREAGDPAQIEQARRALLTKLKDFRTPIAAFLTSRLVAPDQPISPAKPPGTAPASPAAAALAAALRSGDSKDGTVAADAAAVLAAALGVGDSKAGAVAADAGIAALIEAWAALEQPGVPARPETSTFAPHWHRIATRPDGRALLELRERAAREALARIVPEVVQDDEKPLSVLFRQALENAISREALDVAGRLLALDRLSPVLHDAERNAWAQAIELVKRAESFPPGNGSAGARMAWMQLLQATDSPAAGALAVRKLKAASATPPRQ